MLNFTQPRIILSSILGAVRLLAGVAFVTASLTAAAQVALINPSFESPVLEDGQTISPVPSGNG